MSKASGGKISFTLVTSMQAAWKAKLPNAPTAISAFSRYPHRQVSVASISDHVDASLVRQLESVLLTTRTAGKCDTLGAIATGVLDAVLATWTGQTLDATPSMRRDFLAWLGNIGPVYRYKRGQLVALRQTPISASDPPSAWWPGER